MPTTAIEKWTAQFYKGYLELVTILILRKHGECYGAQIRAVLAEQNLLINEGTLYPLLNRMEVNGWLKSRWITPVTSGHPRRLYFLQPHAEELLQEMLRINADATRVLNGLEAK